MPIHFPEYNTIVTFLGMLCAMVQAMTGAYAAYYRKKTGLLKANDILNRSHRAFGGFATTLYLMGLFAGVNGLIGALTHNEPPLELQDASFNIHTWGSFPVLFVWIWKTWLSYFDKKLLYTRRKWLGIAMFIAWSYNWITAAISYYVRTVPPNKQHPDPVFLLPFNLAWLQILLPYLLGGVIGYFIVRAADRLEHEKLTKVAARKTKQA